MTAGRMYRGCGRTNNNCSHRASTYRYSGSLTLLIKQPLYDVLRISPMKRQLDTVSWWLYSRTPLIRPPAESHWCGRIRGMVSRDIFCIAPLKIIHLKWLTIFSCQRQSLYGMLRNSIVKRQLHCVGRMVKLPGIIDIICLLFCSVVYSVFFLQLVTIACYF